MTKITYTQKDEQRVIAPITSEHIRGFGSLFDETKYDVGGTFTFVDGNTIHEADAKTQLKKFLNKIDKVYFGNKASRKKIRVERAVFIHRKHEGGRFIHFHVWFRKIGMYHNFNQVLENVWMKAIRNADVPVVKPLSKGAAFYGWREDMSALGLDSWMDDCSHTDSGSREYQHAMINGQSIESKQRALKYL